MNRFSTALTTWFAHRTPALSLRGLALDADLADSVLHQYRSGKRPITFDALTKLLPAIERHSNRTEALTLHVAYLLEEVVKGYETDLRISAIDATTQAPSIDAIQERANRWAQKARTEHQFEAMWAGLDGYIVLTAEQQALLEAQVASQDSTITALFDALDEEDQANRKPSPQATAFATSVLNEQPGSSSSPPREQKPVNYKDAVKKPRKVQSPPKQED